MEFKAAVLDQVGAPLVVRSVRAAPLPEYAVSGEASALRGRKGTPFDRPCLLGGGVMTGGGGAVRMARVTRGGSALGVVCGAVGLTAFRGAAIARAEPIIAVDVV